MKARIITAIAVVALMAGLSGFGNPCTFMEACALGQEPAEPEPVESLDGAEPAEEAEEVQEPAEEAEPDPEVVEQPEPEPVTLGDVYGALQAAITAEAANQVTVGAATDALEAARQALVDAEQAHADAMRGQGERDAGVRTAAQAFVDFLTLTYLQPQE